jgi:predicted RNase H-like nuclease (RuvC/YqgF family)
MGRLVKRIQQLENLLEIRTHEVLALQSQCRTTQTSLSREVASSARILRECKRLTTTSHSLRGQFEAALEIIATRDAEIKELRRLIRLLQGATQSVLTSAVQAKLAEDRANLATLRHFRKGVLAMGLRTAYTGSPVLQRMAERHIEAVTRWEERRIEFENQQKRRYLAVLAATHALDEAVMSDDLLRAQVELPRVTGTQKRRRTAHPTQRLVLGHAKRSGPLIITPLLTRELSPPRASGSSRQEYRSPTELADAKLLAATASPQQLERELSLGVVACPLDEPE